jgi:hypothetical protein
MCSRRYCPMAEKKRLVVGSGRSALAIALAAGTGFPVPLTEDDEPRIEVPDVDRAAVEMQQADDVNTFREAARRAVLAWPALIEGQLHSYAEHLRGKPGFLKLMACLDAVRMAMTDEQFVLDERFPSWLNSMFNRKYEPLALYTVLAQPHNGGHGAWPAVVLLTPDPVLAVKTARIVEQLGYEIDWRGDVIRVDRIAVNAVLSRDDHKHGGMTIYSRYQTRLHVDRELGVVEDVFDADIAELLGVTVSDGYLTHSVPTR